MDKKEQPKEAQEIESEMITLKPSVACEEHEFAHVSGLEVKCKNCPVGYQLGAGAILKDGHIYIGEQLLI